MWIKLSCDTACFFGPGGINRIEPRLEWVDSERVQIGSNLYINTSHVATVDEKVSEIIAKLEVTNEN